MRLQGGGINAEFASWLDYMSYDPCLSGSIELPQYIPRVSSDAELCKRVFPDSSLARVDAESDFFASRAILAVHNAELLQSIDLPGLPPSILQLKVGASIMLLRNF